MKTSHIAAGWSVVPGILLFGAALVFHRPAEAVPAFAQQTGRNCAACHVGGFGPQLTQFGSEFKLGGYTLRLHPSIPLSAMAVASYVHTSRAHDEAPTEDSKRNNNLSFDEGSIFLAGGIGSHVGGFAQVTYSGADKAWAWDNMDLRAVGTGKIGGKDLVYGLSLNNNPGIAPTSGAALTHGFGIAFYALAAVAAVAAVAATLLVEPKPAVEEPSIVLDDAMIERAAA